MLYYIENAAKKCLIPIENTEKRKKQFIMFQVHIIQIQFLKKNIFQTLNLSEMAITNITEINVGKRKINIESTKQKKENLQNTESSL